MKNLLLHTIIGAIFLLQCLCCMNDQEFYFSTLYQAIKANDLARVKELLPYCSDINSKNEFKQNMLHVVLGYTRLSITGIFEPVAEDKIEMIKLFLARGILVNEPDKFNITPLHRACERGSYSIASLLIKAGANVAAQYSFVTPLHGAARSNNSALVQLLLDNNASVNKMSSYLGTPLDCALDSGALKIAELLLSHNAVSAWYCNEQIAKRLQVLRFNT